MTMYVISFVEICETASVIGVASSMEQVENIISAFRADDTYHADAVVITDNMDRTAINTAIGKKMYWISVQSVKVGEYIAD